MYKFLENIIHSDYVGEVVKPKLSYKLLTVEYSSQYLVR